MNLVQTYILHDMDPSGHGGAKRINRLKASEYNAQGFGIFQTVQEFRGPRRLSNLVHINAWVVDIDGGSKDAMLETIKRGLIPTMVVETKNGFHLYWKAKDATQANWRPLLENRLIPFYNADKKAKDLARILRVPGFYHLKDPSNPFLVSKVHYQHVEYSEREMFRAYPDVETPKKQQKLHRSAMRANPVSGPFWERVWNLNCEYALEKLSGTEFVNGEEYSFRENANGNKNIYVNGKSSSCWITQDGRIGSMDGGGPTVAQWLNWFHKDWPRTISIMKSVFPELNDSNHEVGQLSLL